MSLSTKWRIYITEDQTGGPFLYLWEIQMRATYGGDDLCSGGTATAQSSSINAFKAFDDNAANPYIALHNSVPTPNWIQYEFTEAVSIVEYTIYVHSQTTLAPKSWVMQYWDGGDWVEVDDVVDEAAWGAAETRTYTTSVTPPAPDPEETIYFNLTIADSISIQTTITDEVNIESKIKDTKSFQLEI